jgi:hypothetical protein
MQPRMHVHRASPVPLQDVATVAGAIACVLAAAILYLCFMALALLGDDDDDALLGRVAPTRALIVAAHSHVADLAPRG